MKAISLWQPWASLVVLGSKLLNPSGGIVIKSDLPFGALIGTCHLENCVPTAYATASEAELKKAVTTGTMYTGGSVKFYYTEEELPDEIR